MLVRLPGYFITAEESFMKRIAVFGLAVLFAFSAPFVSGAKGTEEIRMLSTIGPVSSGVLGALTDAFTKESGIKVVFEGAGTGAALEKAKLGNTDIVLVHARKLEDQFIADGFGIDRRDIMYNDYVVLGPKSDPAQVRGETDIAVVLRKIADGKHLFVTRGDRSGTHMAELGLWEAAGIDINAVKGDWYDLCPDGPKGNGPTGRYASGKDAYVIVERATWLSLKDDINLELLMSGDPRMKNFMAVIRLNPKTFEGLNVEGALKLADWIVSDPAQELIKDFGVAKYGEPMFFPNSDQWREKHQ